MLLAGRGRLAAALQSPAGATLAEVFTFVSSLYFRGKLHYATAFATPPPPVPGCLVITPTDGLRPPQDRVDLARLREFAAVDIAATEARYRVPLKRDARVLAAALAPHPAVEVVLLGSIATDKYAAVLAPVLGDRLAFPAAFVGRGDMSRGGLLLRAVVERRELDYLPLTPAASTRSRHLE